MEVSSRRYLNSGLILALLLAAGLWAGPVRAAAPCPIEAATQAVELVACAEPLTGEAVPAELRAAAGSRGRWLDIRLDNRAGLPLRRILSLGVPDAYAWALYQEDGGAWRQRVRLGRDAGFGARPFPHRKLMSELELAPGPQRLLVFAHIHGEGRILPRLYAERGLRVADTRQNLLNGLILGIMLSMIAVILVYRYMVRQAAYTLYGMLVFGQLLAIPQIEGYWFPLLWPDSPAWNLWMPNLLSAFTVVSHALFAMAFFRLPQRAPRLNRVHWLAIAALAASPLLGVPERTEAVLPPLAFAYGLLALYTAAWAFRARLPGAPLYLLGTLCLMSFSVLLFGLGVLGLNPFPGIDFFAYPKFGFLLESLFFAAALVNRLRQFQEHQAEMRLHRLAEMEALLQAERDKRAADERARRQGLRLATASHDISQPLASLGFAIEALRARTEHAPIAEHIASTLSYAQTLLRDIIEQTREEQARDSDDVVLGDLFAQIERQFRAQAAEKGLRLDYFDSQREVRASELILRRILHNLVGNALRYTQKGRVFIGLRTRAAGLEIQVLDTGPGLLPEQIAGLEQAFKPASHRESGFGLGLFIVRSLCAEQGYVLRLRSELGRGSCFGVLIPWRT